MKKRMLCILLLAAICTSAVACGGEETPAETTTETTAGTVATETETTDEPILPDTDMDGWTLRVANVPVDAFGWAQITFHSEELNGEPLNDAIYNRDLALMERFGYTIEETTLENVEVRYIQEMVIAGDDLYDLCLVYDIRLPEVIGYAGSWDALSYVQLDKPWWNPDATGVFDIGGEHYVVAGDYTVCYQSRAMCYLFNKNLYTNLGYEESLYDLVLDYKWTTDKFIEIAETAKLDLNGDGSFTEVDQYGVFGNPRAYLNTMMGGAGISFVSKNDEGHFVFDLAQNNKAVDLLEKFVTWSGLKLDYNTGKVAWELTPDTLFKDGQALFNVGGMPHTVASLRDMNDEFGIVPLPMADESQGRYYSVAYGGLVGLLPKTVAADRMENLGIVMEAMTYATYKDVLPLYKEELVKTKYSRDEDSLAMLDIVFDTITFDPGILIWCSKISDNICENLFMKGNTAIVSYLTEKTQVYQSEIDKFNEAIVR